MKKPLGGQEYAASFAGSRNGTGFLRAERDDLRRELYAERALADRLAAALREVRVNVEGCDDPDCYCTAHRLLCTAALDRYDTERGAK